MRERGKIDGSDKIKMSAPALSYGTRVSIFDGPQASHLTMDNMAPKPESCHNFSRLRGTSGEHTTSAGQRSL